MITDIETGILTTITDKFSEIRKGAIQKDSRNLMATPSVAVSIVDGKFRKVSQSTYKIEASVSILLTFKDMKGEAERRKGVHPLLEGIFGLLLLKDFGLAIDQFVPELFQEVTTDQDYTNGVIKYLIRFRTGWNIAEQFDEVVTDLLSIGLSYYLQDPSDDGNADASDTVTLSQ